MNLFEIFKPGRHVSASGEAIEFTEEQLRASAAAYDPSLHEAPITVGHPKDNKPAYGWVQALSYDESLKAQPHQVETTFEEMVTAGRFKKRSASFYKPDSPNNPKPGVYYLRHVAFLGAQPPAVKGLKDVSFADADEGIAEFGDWTDLAQVRLLRRIRDFFIAKFGTEEADKALPSYELESLEQATAQAAKSAMVSYNEPPQETQPMKALLKLFGLAETATEAEAVVAFNAREARFAEREAAITTKEQAVATKEASFAEREGKLRDAEKKTQRTTHESFIDGLIKEGKVLPAQKAEKLEFMCGLSSEETLEFGEGDKKVKKSPLAIYMDQLKTGPKIVDFKEHAGGATATEIDVADPNAIAKKALEYQDSESKVGRTVDIATAVQHVMKSSQQ